MSSNPPRKVLLIGWDAADWKLINPLLDAGKMPALESLLNDGVMGSIATLHPVLSPMLWSSIATGKRPFKHGVLGFTEPVPGGGGIRPVSSLSRKVKAVWNILNQNGYRSIIVGWWPSHPAEPLNGVMVSNHYARAVGSLEKPWPLLPGAIHPPRLADQLAELRFHPNELAVSDLLSFVQRAGEIEQDKDPRLAGLAKIVAEITTIQAAATWLMSHEPWDFLAVYFDGIDHLCHAFMKYHPPRRDFIPERDYEVYHGVVEGGYCYHDLMLRTLIDLAGGDTTIVLVSDHGFHPDHLRPRRVPREPAGPAYEHRDLGVFVMKGPGIKRDEYVHGVNLLDITPTVLTLFNLPVGEDMDGRALVEAFEEPLDVSMIPSWEDVPGEDGCHPPDARFDSVASQEAINQLVALGYIEQPDENRERAIANTVRELRFNLARSYMDAGLHGDAVPILQELYSDRPNDPRPGIQLAMCYRALGDIATMSRVVNELLERRRREAEQARATLKDLMAEFRRRKAQREAQTPDDGRDPSEPAPDRDSEPLITEEEWFALRRLRVAASIPTYELEYLAGVVAAAEGRYEAALEHLTHADRSEPNRPGLHLQIGETYLKLKRWEEAERAFAKAAALDGDSAHAHLGLCRSYLPRGRNRLAAQEALATLTLQYQYPLAHFCLGLAMHRLGEVARAVEALQVAVALNPNFLEAHRRLAWIYRRRLNDLERSAEHQRLARQIRAGERRRHAHESRPRSLVILEPVAGDVRTGSGAPVTNERRVSALTSVSSASARDAPPDLAPEGRDNVITVVTGLPRSGTSMLMRMLSLGGLPLLADGIRQADVENPLGYFEYDRAKRLRQDRSWLADARGKVVKIVAQLVPFLPPDYRYTIIFIERDLGEVLASQRAMLDRSGRKGAALTDVQLQTAFRAQLSSVKAWLRDHGNARTLFVRYSEILDDPAAGAAQIDKFLGGGFDTTAMAHAVDIRLSRQRVSLESFTDCKRVTC